MMDSTLWKINGSSAASEGLRDLRLILNNQVPDSLVFNADGLAFDAAALFDYGESLSLYKGTVRWLEGVVLAGPRFGSPSAERHDYTVAGLWWYLEQLVFEQEWRAGTLGDTLNKSHVILGRDIENEPVSAGNVIKEALDYAIDAGAPFTYSAADLAALSAMPPPDEQVDLACSEVVRKMLRWIPDTVAWFDYAATTPVLHFTRRGSASAVQYSCTAGDPAEQIDITARNDLVKAGVIINYERIDTIDGERIPALQQDIYPEGSTPGFDTASLTINIPGSQLATQSTEVVVKTYTTMLSVVQDYAPNLVKGNNEITEHSRPALPSVLVSGQVPSWSGKTAEDAVFSFTVKYTDDDGSDILEDLTINVVATDAETHTYTKELSYTPADPYPTGLAQSLYNAISTLHFQGRFQTVEEEVTGGVRPGNTLNLTGGLAAWATMAAAIQAVEFDIDAGRTSISFGPPEHLGPQDAIALLNANRTRITLYSGDARKTGAAGGGEDIATGGGTPDSSARAGSPRYSKLVVDNGADPLADPPADPESVKKITIDSAQVKKGKTLVGVSATEIKIDWPRLHKIEDEVSG